MCPETATANVIPKLKDMHHPTWESPEPAVTATGPTASPQPLLTYTPNVGDFGWAPGQSAAWPSQKWVLSITHTFRLHVQLFTYCQLPKVMEKSFSS